MSDENPDHSQTYAKLGEIVVRWNGLENLLRLVLWTQTDDSAIPMIFELGTTTLCNAVRAVAARRDSEHLAWESELNGALTQCQNPIAPHIDYFVELFERLRAYRNFYVHGIQEGTNGALIFDQVSAKPFVKFYSGTVDPEQFEWLIKQIGCASTYGIGVHQTADFIKRNHPRHGFGHPVGDAIVTSEATWPEKPPLPERLQKPLH